MLYGDKESMAPLAAGAEDSVLRMKNGVPQWVGLDATVAELSGVKVMTGNYTGNNAKRNINLSASPKLLFIWGEGMLTMADGFKTGRNYQDSYDYYGEYLTYVYTSTLELDGSVLKLYTTHNAHDQNLNPPTPYFNETGKKYNWVALVEVTA